MESSKCKILVVFMINYHLYCFNIYVLSQILRDLLSSLSFFSLFLFWLFNNFFFVFQKKNINSIILLLFKKVSLLKKKYVGTLNFERAKQKKEDKGS